MKIAIKSLQKLTNDVIIEVWTRKARKIAI